jgi:hypothetical protein
MKLSNGRRIKIPVLLWWPRYVQVSQTDKRKVLNRTPAPKGIRYKALLYPEYGESCILRFYGRTKKSAYKSAAKYAKEHEDLF